MNNLMNFLHIENLSYDMTEEQFGEHLVPVLNLIKPGVHIKIFDAGKLYVRSIEPTGEVIDLGEMKEQTIITIFKIAMLSQFLGK